MKKCQSHNHAVSSERKKRRNWKNERVAWMKTHTELIECWSDRCYRFGLDYLFYTVSFNQIKLVEKNIISLLVLVISG